MNSSQHSHWIQTYTGLKFDLRDPQPDMVSIADIAHALSLIPRFGGHTEYGYSVGQHSLHVAALVADHHIEVALEALMHDAAEAYIGDMVRPLKSLFPEFVALEHKIQNVIRDKFQLGPFDHPAIVMADQAELRREADTLLEGGPILGWARSLPHIHNLRRIQALTPSAVELYFSGQFSNLYCARRMPGAKIKASPHPEYLLPWDGPGFNMPEPLVPGKFLPGHTIFGKEAEEIWDLAEMAQRQQRNK